MADTPDVLAGRLLDEGEKAVAFFQSLTSQDWEGVVYTEGAHWTPRQVLGHFLSSEIAMRRLVENILAGGPGSPEDFDLNAYNERKAAALKDRPISDLLAEFSAQRRETARLVAALNQDDLVKRGRHPFLGPSDLVDIIKIMYRHNMIHIREVRQALERIRSAD